MLAACAAQELAPARPGAPRRRLEPSCEQQPADRARRDAEAELEQLAGDPPVAPARILARQPQHQLAHARPRSADGPARAAGCVHFRRTSSRCQRSSVCGVTISPRRRGAGAAGPAPRARHDRLRATTAAAAGERSTDELMPQNEQLDVLGELAAPAPNEQPQNSREREVSEGEEHPPMLPGRPKVVRAGEFARLERFVVVARAREPILRYDSQARAEQARRRLSAPTQRPRHDADRHLRTANQSF